MEASTGLRRYCIVQPTACSTHGVDGEIKDHHTYTIIAS